MKRILLFGTVSLFFAQLVFMFSSYGANIFLARALGPSAYGIYAVVISLATLLLSVLVSGLQVAITKFVSRNPSKAEVIKNSSLKMSAIVGIFASVVYFFSADLIAFIFKDASLVPFIRLSALIIPGYLLYSIFLGHLNGLKQYSKQSLLTILFSLSKISAIILFVLYGFSVFGAIFGFVLAPLIGLAIGVYLSPVKKTDEQFSPMKLLLFSIPITIFAFAFKGALTIGLFSVKSVLMQNALVGYYNAALQISWLPYYFTMALGSALFPFVAYSFSNETPAELKWHIKKSLKYFLVFVVPGSLFLSFFSLPIITILFGQEFIASAEPLAVLGLAALFFCLFYILCIILIGIEKQKLAMALALVVLAIAWLSNIALVPIFSLNGAAIATLIAFLIGSIIAAIAVWRFLPKAASEHSGDAL